jgi:thiamine biosynthesis lipoprotein
MSRGAAWFVHAATLLVGLSGLVYAVMRYLLRPAEPYAVVHHPWQPAVQHLHVLCAPLLVFAAGFLWRAHVWPGLCARDRRRRASGLAATAALVPMVVSGPFLQTTTDERWRSVWVVVHVASSLLWTGGYVAHQVASLRGPRRSDLPRPELAPRQRAAVGPRTGTLGLVAFGALVGLAAPWLAAGAAVEREVALMGTVLRMTINAETRAAALAASERALAVLDAAELRLSTWRDDTELACLNRAPVGAPRTLSPELAAELARARFWVDTTAGAFDPGIGALANAWGLRSGGRVPDAVELERARAAAGLRMGLVLDEEARTATRLDAGFAIDEGGFGKGAALDAALRALAAAGVEGAVLDLGGQVAVLGAAAPLNVPVADPRDRERAAIVLPLRSGSLATSGNSERGVAAGGRRIGHLLDPRRGEPAADFGSMTVLAASALDADCLSTGLFVLGPDSALAWALEHPGIEVLVLAVAPGGLTARATPALAAGLIPVAPDLAVD